MSELHAANTTSFETCKWGSHGFEFEVYDSIDAEWREVGGLFLFVSLNLIGKWSKERRVVYVEATTNFASSIPNHRMWGKASQLGIVAQVHTRLVEHARLRHELEDSLLDGLRPRLNFQ